MNGPDGSGEELERGASDRLVELVAGDAGSDVAAAPPDPERR